MAKSSADDVELRRACETAMEGSKVVLSIRVAKSRGVWGKSNKIGKGQMAKPRVLAISKKENENEKKIVCLLSLKNRFLKSLGI
nr:exocyst complex component SEC3A-like [Tanacetum cinerariifolium]